MRPLLAAALALSLSACGPQEESGTLSPHPFHGLWIYTAEVCMPGEAENCSIAYNALNTCMGNNTFAGVTISWNGQNALVAGVNYEVTASVTGITFPINFGTVGITASIREPLNTALFDFGDGCLMKFRRR